jgi:hypothetical protein
MGGYRITLTICDEKLAPNVSIIFCKGELTILNDWPSLSKEDDVAILED